VSRVKRTKARARRLLAVRADEVRAGDVLWSSATERELRVVSTHRELVRADGNLYADPEDPSSPQTEAIVVLVMDETTRQTQRLGAYAPRARLQVVRHVARLPVPFAGADSG
jgi:hypothetical protein